MTGPRYVYAVCRPFDAVLQAQLTGVAGAPAALLRHHGLIAVVSTVPEADFADEPLRVHLENPQWRAVTARAHQGVIDALTTVTTPLPLRVGTVFRDDSGVRSMLEAREDEFHRTLDRLQGRVEWEVKVYEDVHPAEPAGSSALDESGWSGMARQDADGFASRLHRLLAEQADDTRLHAPQEPALSALPGRNVLNSAYLVPRAHSEEFVEAVEHMKAEAVGVRVELGGPWAAYSFTGRNPGESRNTGASRNPGEIRNPGERRTGGRTEKAQEPGAVGEPGACATG